MKLIMVINLIRILERNGSAIIIICDLYTLTILADYINVKLETALM